MTRPLILNIILIYLTIPYKSNVFGTVGYCLCHTLSRKTTKVFSLYFWENSQVLNLFGNIRWTDRYMELVMLMLQLISKLLTKTFWPLCQFYPCYCQFDDRFVGLFFIYTSISSLQLKCISNLEINFMTLVSIRILF